MVYDQRAHIVISLEIQCTYYCARTRYWAGYCSGNNLDLYSQTIKFKFQWRIV